MANIVDESSGWLTVDRDPQAVSDYLETLTRLLDAMKRRSIELLGLKPGDAALDVGCGLGRDAELLLDQVGATGRVVGVDASRELIEQATLRTSTTDTSPEFRVGDAMALEFGDGTFDACRADRLLQHLNDPARAVAEMVRVTRSGGRVSILDADWHTMTIAGGDVKVAQAVTRQHASIATRQGDVGRRLVQLLMDAGCADVEIDPRVLWMRDLRTADFVLHIRAMLDATIASGSVSRGDGEAWWKAVQDLDARGCSLLAPTA